MLWRDFLLACDLVWRLPPQVVQMVMSLQCASPEMFQEYTQKTDFKEWLKAVFPEESEPKKLEKWQRVYVWIQGLSEHILARSLDPWRAWWEEKGLYVTTRIDPDFPTRLLLIELPPTVVWWSRPPTFHQLGVVAVVGSRDMTEHGALSTRVFVHDLVSNFGVTIVSGCARGIDLVAHQAALRSGGQTVGFLGSGLAQADRRVQSIMREGWLASEFPPEMEVRPWHFQQRNRLIAGLSEVVAVVEAKKESGTMITASAALDQGKPVYVMGQPFAAANCDGIVELAEKGMPYIHSAQELWKHWKKGGAPLQKDLLSTVLARAATETEEQIILFLWHKQGKMLVGEVASLYKEREKEWREALFVLEMKGVVVQQAGVVALSCMIQS